MNNCFQENAKTTRILTRLIFGTIVHPCKIIFLQSGPRELNIYDSAVAGVMFGELYQEDTGMPHFISSGEACLTSFIWTPAKSKKPGKTPAFFSAMTDISGLLTLKFPENRYYFSLKKMKNVVAGCIYIACAIDKYTGKKPYSES